MQKALCARRAYGLPTSEPLPYVKNKTISAVFKTLFLMKLVIVLCTLSLLQAHARSYGQLITLRLEKAGLDKAIAAIEKQSGYHFIYAKEELDKTKPVSINVSNASITTVLDLCFEQQPLQYTIQQRYIVLKRKAESPDKKQEESSTAIRGKITNEKGEAIAGATIRLKGSNIATSSNVKGEFELTNVSPTATLIITGAELETEETAINFRSYIAIVLKAKVSGLDQVLIMAYGETTKRLNTGNIAKVTAAEIERQPVGDPLAALQGRVAGMTVNATSGISGSAFKVQIRGRHSILSGTEPLFIVDGIPYGPGNESINQITTAAVLSPLYLINPGNIESIEILKDADATAIYGSRGANGVVLITTKKGKQGKTELKGTVYNGSSKVTRTMRMLNLQEYLSMRREALANDAAIPSASNAPDLLVWDTTRYTDLKKLLIGGTAHTTDAQVSLSGGNSLTSFLLGAGYHRETTVFPTELANNRISVHLNLNHASSNEKFKINLTTNYANNKNRLTAADVTSGINYAPNIKLYDSTGKLNWQENGVSFRSVGAVNPLANINTRYTGQFQNLLSNLLLSYRVLPNLHFKVNLGYNLVLTDETRLNPTTSFDPYRTSFPFSYFATGNQKSWILEPQAEYIQKISKGKLSVIIGSTTQENISAGLLTYGENYQSDLVLGSIAGAGKVSSQNIYSQYRYQAIFGRINYNWLDKYIVNITGRRDGSSRFGPANRYSNFGSAGGAWIFTKEKWMRPIARIISFGKIRGSYGTTGNDKIGDYQFLDTWSTAAATYQTVPVLSPGSLFNPLLAWETTNKFELAIEIGLLKDRLLLSAAFYKNRSGNQLVPYALPIQTGFNAINKNFDALIENRGYEFTLSSHNYASANFNWKSSFNISFPKNILVDFPGLATSSYANNFVTGQSLSVRKLFEYEGVDPATGVYQFKDVDRNGQLDIADQVKFKSTDPKFFGGLSNSLSYKNLQFDIFFEFKKQEGLNYLNTIGYYPPGYNVKNQPSIVLNRWQQPGDKTTIAKYTGIYGTSGYYYTVFFLPASNAVFSDASFIRCKNLSVSYTLPSKWLAKMKLTNTRLFLQGQNLFTITNYEGADPETQHMFFLPPLKTMTAGIQLTF